MSCQLLTEGESKVILLSRESKFEKYCEWYIVSIVSRNINNNHYNVIGLVTDDYSRIKHFHIDLYSISTL